ncbi:DNA-3-methyladenine glycosylase family protein [Demetria terragena]|uniref:DNA-3-methyladenine glycosylase family protein n=1 Tax=Demetria terragena TaxID=63959 RepID=UPI000374EFFF|nr:hypothetical protein [Demetria terragena]
MTESPAAEVTYAPGRVVPLRAIIGPMRRGPGDPTFAADGSAILLGQRTPEGPATLRIDQPAAEVVHLRAWGPGAGWSIRQAPALLGDRDDPSGFAPSHPLLRRLHHEHPHDRVPRSGLVVPELVPVILEQRVTGAQAFAAYRRLVRTYGEVAPGPGATLRLMVAPTVEGWRQIPSWEWLRAGVDAQRSDTVMRALRVAHRLDECVDLPLADAHRRLRAVPGIGAWTVAEVAQRALGDADAVSVGDYHVAKNITYALEGTVGDDARMLELLRPYAGHRFRVQRLIGRSGRGRPRRGPRLSLPTHLPA